MKAASVRRTLAAFGVRSVGTFADSNRQMGGETEHSARAAALRFDGGGIEQYRSASVEPADGIVQSRPVRVRLPVMRWISACSVCARHVGPRPATDHVRFCLAMIG